MSLQPVALKQFQYAIKLIHKRGTCSLFLKVIMFNVIIGMLSCNIDLAKHSFEII